MTKNPQEMTRKELLAALRERGALAGLSRATVGVLRAKVAELQSLDGPTDAEVDLSVEPSTDPAVLVRLAAAAAMEQPTSSPLDLARAVQEHLCPHVDAFAAVATPGYQAAEAEWKALKKWASQAFDGETDPETCPMVASLIVHRCETPEARKARQRAERGQRSANGSRRRAEPGPAMTFLRNGEPMPKSLNHLYDLAWHCTAGLDGDRRRIGSRELTAILAGEGVENPTSTEWDVELANGVKIGARFAATS